MNETTLLVAFSWMAAALLLFVTGGIAYLTVAEWRDRRRREQETRR